MKMFAMLAAVICVLSVQAEDKKPAEKDAGVLAKAKSLFRGKK